MSQENVELVRRMLDTFADGGLDAMAEHFDPEINWRAAEDAVDDVGEMRGPVAVRRYVQDWIDTFDDFTVGAEELRGIGGGRVLAIQRLNGRAKLSGTETNLRYAVVYTLREGKVVRVREYLSVEDALEAVGLRE
jgi:ketosteroid isomerase-like protein